MVFFSCFFLISFSRLYRAANKHYYFIKTLAWFVLLEPSWAASGAVWKIKQAKRVTFFSGLFNLLDIKVLSSTIFCLSRLSAAPLSQFDPTTHCKKYYFTTLSRCNSISTHLLNSLYFFAQNFQGYDHVLGYWRDRLILGMWNKIVTFKVNFSATIVIVSSERLQNIFRLYIIGGRGFKLLKIFLFFYL